MLMKGTEKVASFKIFLGGIHNCRPILDDNFMTTI